MREAVDPRPGGAGENLTKEEELSSSSKRSIAGASGARVAETVRPAAGRGEGKRDVRGEVVLL
jgi:hypothetical protein